MPDRMGWLERPLRFACALYPRDFRTLLAADMAALYVREVRRIDAERGRGAAYAFAASALVSTLVGAFPAWLEGVPGPGELMDNLLQDVRFAVRNLIKSPGFTLVAVASLALGIGANSAIFSAVNTVLLRGLPYPDADRLVVIWERNPELGIERTGPSGPTFLDWRERAASFSDMALFQPGSATITDLSEPEQVPGMRVTVNFFDLLGYDMERGRDLLPEESRGGRANSAIASHGFWQRAWGGADDSIGRTFMGDHLPYTLVGVLPPDFWYPLRTDLFVPWDEDELRSQWRGRREHGVLARLRPGVTIAEAREEMDAIADQLAREYPEMEGWGVDVGFASAESAGFLRPALLVLLGAVAFVLLIACANVANLLLVRCSNRRRELALRAATGASRARLLRQLLTESLLLGAVGGVLGLVVGYAGMAALRQIMPAEVPLPGGDATIIVPALAMDRVVFGYTAAVALIAGLVAGLVPAWQITLVDLAEVLGGGDRGNSSSGGAARARSGLVVAEIALAVVLVIGTLLMVETFWNLGRVDPGLDPTDVLTLQIELPTDSRYQSNEEEVEFYRQAVAELEAIPGVQAVGLSEVLPLDNTPRRATFRRLADTAEGIGVDYNLVNPGFFEALRVPLLRGRMFNATDDADGAFVAIVDESFERAYFPAGAVGQTIVFWEREYQIVGVVGAVRSVGLDQQARPIVYLHTGQDADNFMAFLLRARAGGPGLAQAAKEAIWKVDPEQPVFNVRRMDHVVAEGSQSRQLTLTLLVLFGAIALLMASIGVYGVMAYTVSQRTREMGVRRALGAAPAGLVQMVVADAARIALAGVALGLLAALGAARALSSLLYGVSAAQPAAYALVAVIVVLVAGAAAVIPARRAAAVDPMVALRSD